MIFAKKTNGGHAALETGTKEKLATLTGIETRFLMVGGKRQKSVETMVFSRRSHFPDPAASYIKDI